MKYKPCFGVPVILLIFTMGFAQEAPQYQTVKATRIGMQTVYGLVDSCDRAGTSFTLRNLDGRIKVQLTEQARIGLLFRERNVRQMVEQRKVTISAVDREFSLPEKLYIKVIFENWRTAQGVLGGGKFRDGFVYAQPLPDHLPTQEELWLSGELSATEAGHITPLKIVTVGDRTFEGSTSGFNYAEQIAGLFDPRAIQPWGNQASLYGKLAGDVFYADYVFLRPIPDPVATDDPQLPRYLFIGDSISLNYSAGLRRALEGQFNVHHPPTNCGPSGKGKNFMQAWLGGYRQARRHWDVISFNFGHWDAGNTREVYQANLESVIRQLKLTGAELIWVTTCPVPKGYDPAGALTADGKASGRKAGVMKTYLNPWALEVMRRHPEISICDQWQYCQDHENDLYCDWWMGKNVHFTGEAADALGRYLAEHVQKVMVRNR